MNDGQSKKPAGEPPRLVNPDGTTNWKVVFEDPDQGILAAIASARSIDQLRTVMANVALLLFKRKRDAEPRAEFTSMINRALDAISDQGIEVAISRITGILNVEMEMRIEKAALHVKNKESSQSVERRRKSAEEGFMARLFGNPVYLTLGIGCALILFLVGGLVAMQFSSRTTEKQAEQPAEQQQPKQVEQQSPKPQVTPERTKKQTQMIALQPFQITITVNGSEKRMRMVPLIGIDEGDKITPICSLAPRINESILFRMRAAAEQGGVIDRARADEVSARVIADINARSGGQKINTMMIIGERKLPSKIVATASRGCERVSLDQLP